MTDKSAKELLNMLNGVQSNEVYDGEDLNLSAKQLLALMNGQQLKDDDERSVGKKISDWFKGGKREDFIPLAQDAQLGLSEEKALKLTALLTTTASDDRLKRGIKKIFPEAAFDRDQYGNLIAAVPTFKPGENLNDRVPTGQFKQFYPNPVGLQAVDMMQAAGALTLANPIANTLQKFGMGVNKIAPLMAGGAAESGLIELASSQQTDSPYKTSDIPIGAATAGIMGKLTGLVARTFGRTQSPFDPNGNLRPEMIRALERAGIDPGSVTREMLEAATQRARGAADPGPSLRQAEADSLPVSVPLSRGDASGSYGQQLVEDNILKGGRGEDASRIMRDFRDRQQAAIAQNVDEIGRSLGGPPISNMGDGGKAISDSLVGQEAQAYQVANQAYTDARNTGVSFLDVESVQAKNIISKGEEILKDFDPQTAETSRKIFEDVVKNLNSQGVVSGRATEEVTDLFTLRSRLNNITRGTSDSAAGGRLRNVIDEAIIELYDKSLIYGDPESVAAQFDAIKGWAAFKKKWSSNSNILKKLTERVDPLDRSSPLKIEPNEVTSKLFGLSGAKLMNPSLLKDVKKLKANLPDDEWGMMRQEAFKILANRANKSGEGFSGVTFQKNWNQMKTQNNDVVNALFTRGEIKQIDRFASVAKRATGGIKNTSNSGVLLSRLFTDLIMMIGQGGPVQRLAMAPGIKALREGLFGTASANLAQRPLRMAPNVSPAGIASSGILNTEEGSNNLSDQLRQYGLPSVR